MKYLVIDGNLNGTGIRDKIHGGYITHNELRISPVLSKKINSWLNCYWEEFYHQYSDSDTITKLDECGKELALELNAELPNDKVEYFSDAQMAFLK